MSALYLENFRHEYFVLFPHGWYLKHSRAVTTDLNNLREKADSIEIKTLLNLVRLKKTTWRNTVSFKRKITGLRCLEVPLTLFSQNFF